MCRRHLVWGVHARAWSLSTIANGVGYVACKERLKIDRLVYAKGAHAWLLDTRLALCLAIPIPEWGWNTGGAACPTTDITCTTGSCCNG